MFGIPTWVIVLFFVLFYIGINRCFTRVMPLKKIAIIPIVFIIFGLKSTKELFGLNEMTLLYLFMGCLLGGYFGYLQVKNKIIVADKEKYLIQIPGDFSLFISLMLVFIVEFAIHYSIDAHAAIAELPTFKFIAVVISGSVIGLTLGRTATYLYQFFTAIHADLNLPIKD